MGCGSSSAGGAAASRDRGPTRVAPAASDAAISLPVGREPPKKLPPIAADTKPKANGAGNGAAGAQAEESAEARRQPKGGVAFSIPATDSEQSPAAVNDIDKILRRPLPPRLRHLEPLENAPTPLSPEQLVEKQRKAEEKRERMLEKRRNSKATRKSKARRELLKAQEFADKSPGDDPDADADADADGRQSSAVNAGLESLQQKQAAADAKRQEKLAAVKEKQRQRELRAKAARERARKLREESELDIERDEAAGDSDTDSWLGDDDQHQQKQQKARPHLEAEQQRDSSGYSSRDVSGSGDRGSDRGSRVTTGKTVSTVLEDDMDHEFFDS